MLPTRLSSRKRFADYLLKRRETRAATKGGHHREGTLTFSGDASRFFAGAQWIELVLTGVGDVPERTLRWEIGS